MNPSVDIVSFKCTQYIKIFHYLGGKPKTLPVFSEGSEQLKQKVSVYRNVSILYVVDI